MSEWISILPPFSSVLPPNAYTHTHTHTHTHIHTHTHHMEKVGEARQSGLAHEVEEEHLTSE